MIDILNLASLESLARERLDPMLYDYIAGGAADEWTLAESQAAWNRMQLLPRSDFGTRWFQLYVYRDREVTRDLVARAAAAGYSALCLTVDTPYAGHRERDARNFLRMPAHLQLGNFPPSHSDQQHQGSGPGSALGAYINSMWDPSLTWDDVDWLRSIAPMPVVIKGILAPDDAKLAFDHGAAAVIVSNHGGRQLDSAPATITVLRAVVDAVSDRGEILIDGGIRRGTDVLKALALGARAVLVGRPVLWGLTLGGTDGVRAVLQHIRKELDLAMALCGCATVDQITRDLIIA